MADGKGMPGGPGGGMPPAGGGGGAGTGALISGLIGGDKPGGTTPGNKKERISNILMNWVLPAAGAYAASYGGGEQRAANIMLAYLEKNKEESKKRKLGQKIVDIADKYRVADLNAEKALWEQSKPTLDPSTDAPAGIRMKELKPLPMEGDVPAGHTETPKMPESMKAYGRDLSSFLKKTPAPVANPIYDMVGEVALSGDPQAAIGMLSDRQGVMDKIKMDTLALETQKTEAQKARDLQKAIHESEIDLGYERIASGEREGDKDRGLQRDIMKDKLDFDKLQHKDVMGYRDKVLQMDVSKLDRESAGVVLGNVTDMIKSIYQSAAYAGLEPSEVADLIKPLEEKLTGLQAAVQGAGLVYKDGIVQPVVR